MQGARGVSASRWGAHDTALGQSRKLPLSTHIVVLVEHFHASLNDLLALLSAVHHVRRIEEVEKGLLRYGAGNCPCLARVAAPCTRKREGGEA
jgi:hypothetical protein